MKNALYDVWQAIGADLLQSMGTRTLTGKELQGMIGDYVYSYMPEDQLQLWSDASYPQKREWLKEAFPDTELFGN